MIYGSEKVKSNPCETCALGCLNGDGEVTSCLTGLRTAHRNWKESTFGADEYYPCSAKISGHPAQEKMSLTGVSVSHNSEYSDYPEIVTALANIRRSSMCLSEVTERTEKAREQNIPLHCLRVQESIDAVRAISNNSPELSQKKDAFIKVLQDYMSEAQDDYLASRYMSPISNDKSALGLSLSRALEGKAS